MAKKKVSNIGFMPVVETISRKFALRRETCVDKTFTKGDLGGEAEVTINGTTYMGCVGRKVYIIGEGWVTKNTFFMRKPQPARQLSAEEVQAHQNFAAGLAWANAAMIDLSVLVANQEKFLVIRNDFTKKIGGLSAKGYSNMYGFMRAYAIHTLGQGGTLPQDHALPDPV